jgi:hypothetical protein
MRTLRGAKRRGVRRCGHCEEPQATRQSPCSEGPGAMRLPRQGLAISRHSVGLIAEATPQLRGHRCCEIATPRARNIQNRGTLRATQCRGMRRCGRCEEPRREKMRTLRGCKAPRQSPSFRSQVSHTAVGFPGVGRRNQGLSRSSPVSRRCRLAVEHVKAPWPHG